ncbi:MAG TPA: aldehyde dehydrogenase family protein [Caulobacteraceae bacterium]|jgi:aldehyde dehydrogenase (NAD+)
MREYLKFYIDGKWVEPTELKTLDVENPATEETAGKIALGNAADVDKAVAAARKAFATWSQTTLEERIAVMERIIAEYTKRQGDLAAAVTEEMGAPNALASRAQVPSGIGHFSTAIEVARSFPWQEQRGATMIVKEPIGVCAMITPWNWPLNQITCKVAPAIATGCTMILKPSEIAPFSGQIFAEIMDAAGVPAGVFNMIHGDGPGVGVALSKHPDVDMVSFTGSTRAGVEIAKNAAPTVKRVAQELGGKSPNILVDDAGFKDAVRKGAAGITGNSGQTCSIRSRMLVPMSRMDEAIEIAKESIEKVTVGAPDSGASMGPVASRTQWDKIQRLIQAGIDEGATLVSGGVGKPEGLNKGHYVRPTVFANVTNDMTIAREEIFGPVLSILGYNSIEEAVKIANDTDYGLAASVEAQDMGVAREIASQLRAGQVSINGGAGGRGSPFGGYKMSGNGREWGDFGFLEYVETKAILGYAPKPVAAE